MGMWCREVRGYFEERYDFLLGRGLEPEQICWDPGIGFGKTAEHNLALLSNMDKLQVAGRRCCWAFPASACWAPSWGMRSRDARR